MGQAGHMCSGQTYSELRSTRPVRLDYEGAFQDYQSEIRKRYMLVGLHWALGAKLRFAYDGHM